MKTYFPVLITALTLLAPAALAQEPQSDEAPFAAADARSLLDRYCVRCHNEDYEVGQRTGVMWEKVDTANLSDHAETVEKALRKLGAGLMPPAGQVRPDLETYAALRDWFAAEMDRTARPHLVPPGLHRLNRAEYGNAVRDLVGLDVDAARLLPTDDASSGFDNIAGTLSMSPALLEAYLSAAAKISRLAVGTVTAPSQTVYRAPEDLTQDYHVEGLPFGTRGGMLIRHQFPADGEYEFRITPVNRGLMGASQTFGEVEGEQLVVLVDGVRMATIDWDRETRRAASPTVRLGVTGGPHDVGITFLATNFAPLLDFNDKFLRSTIETGGLPGMTFYPHVGDVRVSGPFEASGADDTPSRQRIFVCRPNDRSEEESCAREILSTLARRAYRQMPSGEDVSTLMDFYRMGRDDGDFEYGIQVGLQRILAEPKFIFRVEAEPVGLAPDEPYRISDLELASRLSFFLWSSIPDDELIDLAEAGQLSDPGVLSAQVDRMLDDPRSNALVENFAGQWLNLRNLDAQVPITEYYPDFDDNLRQAFRRETELFFESIVRSDRNLLDLLTANHTFLNERLAKHYGIPNVYGSHFRRVELSDEFDARRGLLGKGSTLTVSARPDRNSLVKRGAWVLGTILGVPAPDPPPGVVFPVFEKPDAAGNVRIPTLKEQMEMHARVEPCKSCHQIMDPIGVALENFDAVGTWRTRDGTAPVETRTELYDGRTVASPAQLREALLRYSDRFYVNFADRLLTYALGRGLEYGDMPTVRSIVRQAAPAYTFTDLVQAVVSSAPFQMNTAPASTSESREATEAARLGGN